MNPYEVWAHPRLANQVLRSRHDGQSEVALRVPALQNARQVFQLEQAVHALPGVHRVSVDALAQRVRVIWDRECTSLPTLLQTFASMHCTAQPLRSDTIDDPRSRQAHDLLKRLLVAGMFAMQVMTYAFVIYIGVVDFVDFTTRGLFRWLSLLSTVPVVLYSAHPYVKGAIQELGERRLGLHLPVALAVWLVFAASAINTVRGSGEIYFDSVSMFVFLLLASRYIELRAQHRSDAQGDSVIDGTPLLAQRQHPDGRMETIPAVELLSGDYIHIAEGATVPADGVLETATVEVDEALFSGESRPVTRSRGEHLVAGSILLTGPARLRVEHSGEATAAARIEALSTRARGARESAKKTDDAELRKFVARVLCLTLGTACAWLLIDPPRAFEAAVAVLVIACPCAFALTAPSALTRAIGVLARRGVLVTDSDALFTMAYVDFAVFDKTGTLTTPHIRLDETVCLRAEAATRWPALAAALARESAHPIARALAQATAGQALVSALDVTVLQGNGITGLVDGHHLRLGRAAFTLPGDKTPEPDKNLWLSDGQGPVAAFCVRETLKINALQTLEQLRATGITTIIASGDSPSRVADIATMLKVDEWHAQQTPADKLTLLQSERRAGHVILAVGDGNNDAPLLAGADVSAALATGTELAKANADFLLLRGNLQGLVDARDISRQVQRVIAQGRRWSLAYNLCAIPFAALGWVPPWLAAIGMSASSLAVVLNAWRIGHHADHTNTVRA